MTIIALLTSIVLRFIALYLPFLQIGSLNQFIDRGLIEDALPRSEEHGADEATDAAKHMNVPGPRRVMEP